MLYVMLLALLALLTVVVYLSLGWLVDLLACWCCWLRCTSVSVCVRLSVCLSVCLCMVGSPACSLPITTSQSVSQLVGLYAACLTAVCSHHDSAVFVCLSVCLHIRRLMALPFRCGLLRRTTAIHRACLRRAMLLGCSSSTAWFSCRQLWIAVIGPTPTTSIHTCPSSDTAAGVLAPVLQPFIFRLKIKHTHTHNVHDANPNATCTR